MQDFKLIYPDVHDVYAYSDNPSSFYFRMANQQYMHIVHIFSFPRVFG